MGGGAGHDFEEVERDSRRPTRNEEVTACSEAVSFVSILRSLVARRSPRGRVCLGWASAAPLQFWTIGTRTEDAEWRVVPAGAGLGGLIIDDYFIISAQPGHAPKEKSEAYRYLEKARRAYALHSLPGSPEKDVVAEEFFKAAGAEIDSSLPTRQQSLVTVGGPLEKRLAMSVLSL